LAVRCNVQKSRPISSVKVKGQRSRSPGIKKRKVRHFLRESLSGTRSSCGMFFFGSGPRGRGPVRRWENQRMLSSFLQCLSIVSLFFSTIVLNEDKYKVCASGVQSGARINISDASCPERIVTISGTTPQIVNAFSMISRRFEEVTSSLCYSHSMCPYISYGCRTCSWVEVTNGYRRIPYGNPPWNFRGKPMWSTMRFRGRSMANLIFHAILRGYLYEYSMECRVGSGIPWNS